MHPPFDRLLLSLQPFLAPYLPYPCDSDVPGSSPTRGGAQVSFSTLHFVGTPRWLLALRFEPSRNACVCLLSADKKACIPARRAGRAATVAAGAFSPSDAVQNILCSLRIWAGVYIVTVQPSGLCCVRGRGVPEPYSNTIYRSHFICPVVACLPACQYSIFSPIQLRDNCEDHHSRVHACNIVLPPELPPADHSATSAAPGGCLVALLASMGKGLFFEPSALTSSKWP